MLNFFYNAIYIMCILCRISAWIYLSFSGTDKNIFKKFEATRFCLIFAILLKQGERIG